MNFKYLCSQYQLGRFRSAAELKPGTVAQVWKLETDLGVFLVRTLNGKKQGETEWRVHQHLRARGFNRCPAILMPYFEQAGLWYQVQEYLTGTMPDPSQPGVAVDMAKLAKRLAAALRDYPGGTLIHGDLGPWNMMRCADGRLMVIDFGEAASGDPYFDYASLLGGVINHTSAEQRNVLCGHFIRELDCDRAHLLEQLHCWAEQGIQQWTGKNEKMVARFGSAVAWAKEHIYDL